MAITQSQVLEQLKRIKGPDLEGNIVDLGLVSEILLRDDKVYFSITVPPDRAPARGSGARSGVSRRLQVGSGAVLIPST